MPYAIGATRAPPVLGQHKCQVIGASSSAAHVGTLINEVPYAIGVTRSTHIGATRDGMSSDRGELGCHTRESLSNEVPYAIGVTQAPHTSRYVRATRPLKILHLDHSISLRR